MTDPVPPNSAVGLPSATIPLGAGGDAPPHDLTGAPGRRPALQESLSATSSTGVADRVGTDDRSDQG
jgi:hypothetical protein